MTAIAIDLGGTHLRWAVVDGAGQRLYQGRAQRPRHADTIVEDVRRAIRECRDRHPEAAAVGICVPGFVRPRGVTATNLDWHDFDLRAVLGDVGLPIALENDTAAGAVGEQWIGRARGMGNVVYLTISTGIGAGIIIDGDVYRGSSGLAGEVGHTVVDLNGLLCGCGRRGCWEMIGSGTAHHRRIHEAFISGTWPNLETEPTPEQVTERARGGDRAATALLLRTARYIGIGVANLVNLYDPQAIIFTGGFARSNWDLIQDYLVEEVNGQALTDTTELVLTELGDDAGLIGAARQAMLAAAADGRQSF